MEDKLWTDLKQKSVYKKNDELYANHILEQYKICVEMADRISARRNLTNVFFLTLNSSIFAGIGFGLEKLDLTLTNTMLLIYIPIIVTILSVWWGLIRSYRNLNSAKYKVIGKLEKRLPSSPFWEAEWEELGHGKDIRKYLPLSFLESFVPLIFLLIHILLIVLFL